MSTLGVFLYIKFNECKENNRICFQGTIAIFVGEPKGLKAPTPLFASMFIVYNKVIIDV